jgi:alpha-pyrone synthase
LKSLKTHINAIGIANPPFEISQSESLRFVSEALRLNREERNRIALLYRASGIETRYSVLEDYKKAPGQFKFYSNDESFDPFPTVGQRMNLYKKTALPLALDAINHCLQKLPDLKNSEITHLITVSCTGMYAPGLDIDLIDSLRLNTSINRTAINFMGCYGAFNALKIADALCKSNPEARVLIVCLELCSLHFLKNKEEDHILSSTLFGDGAAAILLSGLPLENKSLSLESFYCDILREGKDDMAWHISDYGFEMKLSSYVPDLIKGGIGILTENLLKFLQLKLSDIDYYAIHPGGKRILQIIESELGFSKEKNKYAYEVLRNYGNMSSPTVLFVLKSVFEGISKEDAGKNILSFAFGPGLTLEGMLLKVNYC